jgi:hypothetical protein
MGRVSTYEGARRYGGRAMANGAYAEERRGKNIFTEIFQGVTTARSLYISIS